MDTPPTPGPDPSVKRTMPSGSEVRWSHAPLGWVGLLDAVTELLDRYADGWTLTQLKSKFAELRLHYDLPGQLAKEDQRRLREIVHAVAARSGVMCEVCGSSPAPMAEADGWCTRLCPLHQAEPLHIPTVELGVADGADPLSDRIVRTAERADFSRAPHDPDALSPRTPSVPLATISAALETAPSPRSTIEQYARLDIALTYDAWPPIEAALTRAGWPRECALLWSTAPNAVIGQGQSPVDLLALLHDECGPGDLSPRDRLATEALLGAALRVATRG